ncbi:MULTISPECIES: hypothetical protein [Micromonospora]|uniref:hypothetical protein n=1 Tax=Micromonospora TaxID=1873 RepID=UPI002E123D68|nr:hypothetical protein OG712_20165 [Micromonospora maris]
MPTWCTRGGSTSYRAATGSARTRFDWRACTTSIGGSPPGSSPSACMATQASTRMSRSHADDPS